MSEDKAKDTAEDTQIQPYEGKPFEPVMARPDGVEVVTDDDGNVLGVDVDESRILYPRLVMVQRMSGFVNEHEAAPGELWDSLGNHKVWPLDDVHIIKKGDATEAQLASAVQQEGGKNSLITLPLQVVPVVYYEDRVLFEDQQLVCRSLRGGMRAAPGFESPAQKGLTDCEQCSLGRWTGKGASRQPPECNDNLNALCFISSVPLTSYAAVVFARTSRPTGDRMASATKLAHVNPWQVVWGLYTEERPYEKTTYSVLCAKRLGWTPSEVAVGMAAQAKDFQLRAEDVHADPRSSDFGDEGDETSEGGSPPDAAPPEEDNDADPFEGEEDG